ncbi:hypothetical protein AURDEDRAFT_114052 [Auricularia subglabra TFB-10046 SS5]|nr:hypothetical protein AURDEDRAFT_114052 [Auricularia subglabra TFB-10046 SS5]
MSARRSFSAFAVLLSCALVARCAPSKITYDDTASAWTYTPADHWGAIDVAHPCTGCNTQPDPTKARNGTWHDCSKGGSAELKFVGSSVEIYAICPKGIYRSNFTFFLDDEPAGRFIAPEGGCKQYEYNQHIFHKSGLKVAPHVFRVENWIAPGEEFSSSDLVIDYAVVDPSSSASATATHTPNPPPSVTRSTSGAPSATANPGAGKNTTIDDADDFWVYSGPWGTISKAQPCAQCVTKPNPDLAHGTTWHDLSQAGSAQLSFTGTAIWIYTICPGPLEGGGAFSSNFAFTLDGKPDGTFAGPATGCKQYEYNQLVYKADGLGAGTHKFAISNVVAAGATNPSDLLFDYAVIQDGGAVKGDGINPAPSDLSTTTTGTAAGPSDTAALGSEDGGNGASTLRLGSPLGIALALVAATFTFVL